MPQLSHLQALLLNGFSSGFPMVTKDWATLSWAFRVWVRLPSSESQGWPLYICSLHTALWGCFNCILLLLDIFVQINFHWSLVAFHCCVSFCSTAKWISSMSPYRPSFLDFLSILVTTDGCVLKDLLVSLVADSIVVITEFCWFFWNFYVFCGNICAVVCACVCECERAFLFLMPKHTAWLALGPSLGGNIGEPSLLTLLPDQGL